jgi:hypothetical protein
MVSFNQLFVATSIILSEVVAVPFPVSKQSVAAAEVRAIEKFAIESRSLNDVSVVDISVREIKPKTAKPKTTKPQPKKPTQPKTAANGAACPTKKPKGPRDLERRGPLIPGDHPDNIEENQFIFAGKLKGVSEVSVTNLSGCTALFFWDDRNVPYVFHVFCNEEEKKAFEAAGKVGRFMGGDNGVSIVAGSKEKFLHAKAGITRYNTEAGKDIKFFTEPKPKNGLYSEEDTKGPNKYNITAKVGDATRTLKQDLVKGRTKQCQ